MFSGSAVAQGFTGYSHEPTFKGRSRSGACDMAGVGRYRSGSRWMKSKMPCPPGSIPVMKVDQATGLSGGMVVCSGLKSPVSIKRLKLGSSPSSTNCCSSTGSSPSTPSTSTFFASLAAAPETATSAASHAARNLNPRLIAPPPA